MTEVLVEAGGFQLRFRSDEDRKLVLTAFGSSGPAYPQWGNGWVFEPALHAVHADGNTSTDLRILGVQQSGPTTRITLKDEAYEFFVELHYKTFPLLGIIESWSVIRSEEDGTVALQAAASSSLALGQNDLHLTQFHGDWANEANMVEEPLRSGIKVLDSKLAVRAHQFRAPWFLLSKGPLQEDSGEVLAGSLAWSGSFRFSFETIPSGDVSVICGINPFASAWTLAKGESFVTPKMVWAWSDAGAGETSRNLHRYVRTEILRDGDRPRSVLLNNWEATYFAFDESKLRSLIKQAQDLGVDLFLLDDGWFGNTHPRCDDTQGLGDWQVTEEKLPNGIRSLANWAVDHSLRFGLWFEPEMVNPKSRLFEQHPEWVISQPHRSLDLQRSQLVLDLSNPEVQEFAYKVLDDVLREAPEVSYIKWDCNRYLTQPGSQFLSAGRQTHLPTAYVIGLYKVMERLKNEHPTVEVMLCSGGGGRVDYGALRFVHELWPSDMTDPVRRIFIQWGFSHFIPAIGTACHVTDWNSRPLKFAFEVAMSGRLGLDLDLDRLSKEERRYCRDAILAFREISDTVQLGDLYRLESPYSGPRAALLYRLQCKAVVFVFAAEGASSVPLVMKGLDSSTAYQVTEMDSCHGNTDRGIFTGGDLMSSGLPLPAMGDLASCVFLVTEASED